VAPQSIGTQSTNAISVGTIRARNMVFFSGIIVSFHSKGAKPQA